METQNNEESIILTDEEFNAFNGFDEMMKNEEQKRLNNMDNLLKIVGKEIYDEILKNSIDENINFIGKYSGKIIKKRKRNFLIIPKFKPMEEQNVSTEFCEKGVCCNDYCNGKNFSKIKQYIKKEYVWQTVGFWGDDYSGTIAYPFKNEFLVFNFSI